MKTKRIFRHDGTKWYNNQTNALKHNTAVNEEIDFIYKHIKEPKQSEGKIVRNTYEGDGGSFPGYVGTAEKPMDNTYNIHLSAMVQHYHTSESSPTVSGGQKGGYWTYLTKEFVSTIDEIKTPIFFRDILGVKVSGTTTLGGGDGDRYMFAGVMPLVHHMPGIHAIDWNSGTIRHAVTYQSHDEWGTEGQWHFMYKMEYCNILGGEAIPVFERLYKLPVTLPDAHKSAIKRLYDGGSPAQPLYNLITMLELIINVKI